MSKLRIAAVVEAQGHGRRFGGDLQGEARGVVGGQLQGLARELAAGPTVAYRYMKANLDRALRTDLHTCLAHEAEGIVATARTEDHREAGKAFIDKRRPTFRGI